MLSHRALVLLAGDLVALTLFAVLGRSTHDEVIALRAARAVAGTAAPFIVGWLVAAPLLGALRARSTATLPMMPRVVLTSWIAGYPLAMLLRGIALGRTSPLSFYVVALLVPLLLLLVWRLTFALIEGRRGVAGSEGG